MKRPAAVVLVTLAFAAADPGPSACTNFLITRGATADGSTMITYAADSHEFYGELVYRPPGKHPPGSKVDVHDWESGKLLGQIDQVPETYAVVGNINEHQVAVGESTWGGREELQDPKGGIDYGSLMYLALQRSKSAREAIRVMTGLVEKYGYSSTGESFSISDPQEVWILEMIGKGPGRTGAVWVARRIPDGYISGHANAARIRRFPLNDPQSTLYASDVIAFAREKGYFKGTDEEFSFADAYHPPSFGARRFCDGRVWCMFRRAAPSLNLPSDWLKGIEGAEPIPLWIKPERPLTVQDVMGFMRDHFEGTEFDMSKDVGAGPYALPYRWRPMTWKVDGAEYLHERAVSTQQTGFSFVTQSRSWLPGIIGGILWFGVDDTYTTVYFPVYAGATSMPHAFAQGTGSFDRVSWDAAFWVFNAVSNFAYLRYSDMIRDIQEVQRELEWGFAAAVPEVDAAALSLHKQAPRLARDYVTRFSGEAGDAVMKRWQELQKHLLYKYLDGNVKDESGKITHPPYAESWYRTIASATGDRMRVNKLASEKAEEEAKRAKVRTAAESVILLLRARGIAVSEDSQTRIRQAEKLEQVNGWLVRAATAATVEEVLAE